MQPIGEHHAVVTAGQRGQPNTQADVFFTIAVILQGLRTGEGRNDRQTLRTEWFHRTLLGLENFSRFNDAVIQ